MSAQKRARGRFESALLKLTHSGPLSKVVGRGCHCRVPGSVSKYEKQRIRPQPMLTSVIAHLPRAKKCLIKIQGETRGSDSGKVKPGQKHAHLKP